MKVSVNPPSHSYPINMRDPDLRWGEMCAVLDVGVWRVFGIRTSIWVACMRLTLGSIAWGQFVSVGYAIVV